MFIYPEKLKLPFNSRFYFLLVVVFIGSDQIWFEKQYIVKVNPCRVSETFDKKQDIYTDPKVCMFVIKTTEISFIFQDGNFQNHLVHLYKPLRRIFKTVHSLNKSGFTVFKAELTQGK